MKVSNFNIFTFIFFSLKFVSGCMKTPLVSETPDIPIARGGGTSGPAPPGIACPACPNLPPVSQPPNGNSQGCSDPIYQQCANNVIMVTCNPTSCVPLYNGGGFINVITCQNGNYMDGMNIVNDISCQT